MSQRTPQDAHGKHTPGPWHTHAVDTLPWYVIGPDNSFVCEIQDDEPLINAGRARANARLIAQAPRMRGRLEMTANLIEELLDDGAFKRLESGSDRERQALAFLCELVIRHRAILRAIEEP